MNPSVSGAQVQYHESNKSVYIKGVVWMQNSSAQSVKHFSLKYIIL